MLAAKLLSSTSAPPPTDFTLLFNTALGDGSPTIGINLAGTVNCTVNWGDNSTDSYTTTGHKTHTYAAGGIYKVTITGTLTGFGGTTTTYNAKMIQCLSFGTLGLTSLASAFRACNNLTRVPKDIPNTVTNLSSCFQANTGFTANITNWNTANVTNMSFMFFGASNFNQNIGSWSVSNVTNMSNMFEDAVLFNQNIGSWSVGNVTNMDYMFDNAQTFNQNIGSWNVSSVTSMVQMFRSAIAFNQNIGSWNVGNVASMFGMFLNATSFNQNIGSWNVAKVVDMGAMFFSATVFNQNLSGWCVGNIQSEPSSFSTNSALTAGNKPVWGTCPNYVVDGSITFIGAASGTTSATLPAHIAGDLILAFAFRDLSDTPPTLPSGWTNINSVGSNGNSARLAYRVATASGTSSGTWTNANNVIFLVYRGNYDISNIADNFSFTSATGTTTITYSAANYWKNLAWTIAFAGAEQADTSIETPPGTLTLRSNPVTAFAESAAFDSTAVTSGWNTTNVTVTGSATDYKTYVIRLRNKIKPA